METLKQFQINIPTLFNNEAFNFNLNTGLTTLVGPNGTGKTQVLKAIKDRVKIDHTILGSKKVRYLSANRTGSIERYRSKIGQYGIDDAANLSLANKQLLSQRHDLEDMSGDFITLDTRQDIYIKVKQRMEKIFQRELYIEWDSGQMKVFFERVNDSKKYSIAKEASGLINLVSVLTAIYDDEIGLLLLDEPEVSLHPQLQAFLLREISKVAGNPHEINKKIIILSTHSTNMINISSAKELINYVFFTSDESIPKQILIDNPSYITGEKT